MEYLSVTETAKKWKNISANTIDWQRLEKPGKGIFLKMKKITALKMAAVILLASLTACGSGAEDIAQDTDFEAADEIASTPETPNEIILVPETYEDYIKFANNYLQTDDVLQALAILDEGIEKLGAEEQAVDLLSQRKEYVLAGTVAVGTNSTTTQYDDDGTILYENVRECDENGNEMWYQSLSYGEGAKIRFLTENRYDRNGNQIEKKYIDYDSDGNITNISHKARTYDEDGNEIESISYDEDGNIEERTEYEYDARGKNITETDYDEDGKITRQVEIAYDADGRQIKWECYDEYGRCTIRRIYTRDESGNLIQYDEYYNGYTKKEEYERDENGNVIKSVYYDDDGTITEIREYEYDEMDREIRQVRYDGDGTVEYWRESEYDKSGNEIKFQSYNTTGNLEYCIIEYKYDENGRKIYYSHKDNDIVTEKQENEYDKDGNIIREISIHYDSDTGQKESQTIKEYTYDENKNRIGYAENHYDEGGTYSFLWEREYDADDRENAYYLYDNEKSASYQSKIEYDGNGRITNYTGYDKNGTVLVRRETEYDTSGIVMRKNEYDADDNLIRYFENEYDDFGSLIRQAMYENGILKSEKQTSYAYHYIGNIDSEAAEYMDNDMTPEEYNLKQRKIFTRFLNGEEKVRYYINADNAEDGKIVEKTITDLLDFEHIRQYKRTPEYTFLDMTGDGIEELIIFCNDDPERLCVIQCSYGILKVIHDLDGRCDAFLVKYNGRIGICHDWGIQNGEDRHYYYFLDEEGIKEILIDDWEHYDESSEDFKHFYSMNDTDSFENCDISKGEYYNIMSGMVEKLDIDWYQLEEIWEKSTERICWN